MSFAGLEQFRKNLDAVMESKAFKEGTDADRLQLGYRLLQSRYGLAWFGSVQKLKGRAR